MSASTPYLPLESVGTSIVQKWPDGEESVVATAVSPMWAQHFVELHNDNLQEEK